MMNNKIKYIKLLLIAIFITLCMACGKIYAFTINVNNELAGYINKPGSVSNKTGSGYYNASECVNINEHGEDYEGEIGCTYSYSYGWKSKYEENITINAYDMQNNSLLETKDFSKPILAGTSVGISMYSKKVVSYNMNKFDVTYYYTYTYRVYEENEVCEITEKPTDGSKGETKYEEVELPENEGGSCEERGGKVITQRGTEYTIETTTASRKIGSYTSNKIHKKAYEEMKKAAITVIGEKTYGIYLGATTYRIILPDSNDINGEEATSAKHYYTCYYGEDDYTEENIVIDEHGKPVKDAVIDYNIDGFSPNKACRTPDLTKEQDSRTQITYYRIAKTCIDRKTAKVRYIKSEGKGPEYRCKDTEIEVSNETIDGVYFPSGEPEIHWHYFIPINAKSTDRVPIRTRNEYYQDSSSFGECLNIMEKYPVDYFDLSAKYPVINSNSKNIFYTDILIKYRNGEVVSNEELQHDNESFKGDYYKCAGFKKNDPDLDFDKECYAVSDDYKEIKDHGCRVSLDTKIDVEQKFYKEEIDENNINWIKGFNFFYRPIDISNPFPNGITENNIWKTNYYNQTNNTINTPKNGEIELANSFKELTYKTNINIGTIKNYNSKNLYTDWKNMNLDGTSNLINNYNVITRINSKSVYGLGCGPSNENEFEDEARTIKNLLYRSECDVN